MRDIHWLMRPTRARDVDPSAMALVMATRIAVAYQRRGADPLPHLARRTGCAAAAAKLLHCIHVTGTAWPEPFCLSPPCCRSLSHDEATLAALVESVVANDRPGFDAASRDLIDEDGRAAIWRELACLAAADS